VADGAEPQKPERHIPSAGILITKTGPAQFGGSVHECIHTERRSSTGDKMNCRHGKKNEFRIWHQDRTCSIILATVCKVCEVIE